MFRKFYHGAFDYVGMTEGVDRSMLANLGKRRRRRVLICVVLVMALLVALPWAASTPSVYQWLSRVAPPVARFLRPSAESWTADGIRAEVVETTRQGDSLELHITLEDLDADRLNETTLPQHWEYLQGRSIAIGPHRAEYDPATGLLHLYLTCRPSENMTDFDWDRWVTVMVYDLQTVMEREPNNHTIITIKGPWKLSIDPSNTD